MSGIITAIVGFIFVCIVFPKTVKNPTQFYLAFGLVIGVLFLESLASMFQNPGFSRFSSGIGGLLTLGALLLIVLATGGLSLKELTGEFKDAIEVLRRGEDKKEVIVPLTGEVPKRKASAEDSYAGGVEPGSTGQTIRTPGVRKTPESGSLPLD